MTQERGTDPNRDHSLVIGVREDPEGPGDGFSAKLTSYGPDGLQKDQHAALTVDGVLDRVRHWLESLGVTRR
jgi:hypothetical protein